MEIQMNNNNSKINNNNRITNFNMAKEINNNTNNFSFIKEEMEDSVLVICLISILIFSPNRIPKNILLFKGEDNLKKNFNLRGLKVPLRYKKSLVKKN